jgi:hypothetical protein
VAGSIRYQVIIGNSVSEFGTAGYTESTFLEQVIATGSTDTQLSFGGITTADIVYLKSDQALTLNLQSSAGTDIPIDANKPFMQAGTAVTAAYVSNASGTDANIIFRIWGA